MSAGSNEGALSEALAEVLRAHESLLGSDDYTRCVCGQETTNLGGLRAHVVAALAPVVAEYVAGQRAAAWDEGWEAGCNDQQYGDENAQPWTPNPYAEAKP